jgi:hypothetical protein
MQTAQRLGLHSTDLPDHAVQFGRNAHTNITGEEKAYTYTYTFVNAMANQWDTKKTPTGVPIVPPWTDNLIDVGPLVAAGARGDCYVSLDADHPFKLLRVRYSVYYSVEGRGRPPFGAGTIGWGYLNDPGYFEDGYPNSIVATVLQRIRVNLICQHNGQYLYGASNPFLQPGELYPVIPLNPVCTQGYPYGWQALNTHYLFPAAGMMHFEIYNDNPFDIILGAAIQGMKIRL